jgi:hypothetical protein
MAAARGPRTLDVSHRQCLVHYPEDGDGLPWHHRLLLVRGPGTQWIWATPTAAVQLGDLKDTRVFPLRRAGPFPRELAGQIFAFDPLDDGELETLLQEAVEMAELYGFDTSVLRGGSVPVGTWHVSDPRSLHFGEVVPLAAALDPNVLVQRGSVGLLLLDGSWVQAVRVDEEDLSRPSPAADGPVPVASWEQYVGLLTTGSSQDPRLLGDDRDPRGARHLDFREVIHRTKAVELVGFPLQGPRVAPELMVALRDAGQDGFDHHHGYWATRSGAAERSAATRDHRLWSTLLRLGLSYDLLDPANCACLEFAARRLAQIETAVKRNPKAPDYDGLDAMLEATIDSTGAALAPVFSSWFADVRRSQAVILKADRQFREEQAALNKTKGNKGNKPDE